MAVTYKPNDTKAELLNIAAMSGISVDDGMTKAQIITALDAQDGTKGADVSESTTHPNDEQPTQDAQNSATAAADATNEQPVQDLQDNAEGADVSDAPVQHEDEQPTQDSTENMSEYTMFIYAGPSLPNGRLKENAVFRGTIGDVKKYLADVLEDYPQVAKLIIPTCKIGAFSVKVKTAGNAVNNYYNDIVSMIHGRKEV